MQPASERYGFQSRGAIGFRELLAGATAVSGKRADSAQFGAAGNGRIMSAAALIPFEPAAALAPFVVRNALRPGLTCRIYITRLPLGLEGFRLLVPPSSA
jgi:hypothetical protein